MSNQFDKFTKWTHDFRRQCDEEGWTFEERVHVIERFVEQAVEVLRNDAKGDPRVLDEGIRTLADALGVHVEVVFGDPPKIVVRPLRAH